MDPSSSAIFSEKSIDSQPSLPEKASADHKREKEEYPTDGTFYNITIVKRPVSYNEFPHHVSASSSYSHHESRLVAVRQLRCVPTDTGYIEKVTSLFMRKLISMWSSLSHDNICPVLAVYWDNDVLPTIEVPYYVNILAYNRRQDSGSDKVVQVIQVASGLSYLHENEYCHGNLRPTNILIRDDGTVCISDACVDSNMRQITYEDNTPIPASYHYKAPEEILPSSDTCSNVSSKGDVYSLASVAYEVFSGKQPYRGLHASCAVLKIVRNGHRTLQRPSNITSQLWAIMLNCWAFKPDDRPSALKVSSALKGIE